METIADINYQRGELVYTSYPKTVPEELTNFHWNELSIKAMCERICVARQRQDYVVADALRQRLEKMGMQVFQYPKRVIALPRCYGAGEYLTPDKTKVWS